MSKSYDYRKTWVTENEVQIMLEGIGAAIETGDLSGLTRSREIGAAILADMQDESE